MRILHTSDWHLGKRLLQFSRLEEQRSVLKEIVELAEQEAVDLVLISGDLFDSFIPPVEAQELLYSALKELSRGGSRPVIAIAGNHDSADSIQAPDVLARLHGIILAGYPHLQLPGIKTEGDVQISFPFPGLLELKFPAPGTPLVRVIATPYANERRFHQIFQSLEIPTMDGEGLVERLTAFWKTAADSFFQKESVNILMAHLFCIAGRKDEEDADALREPEDEKPILYPGGLPPVPARAFPEYTQYVALGHLHGKQLVAEKPFPVCYPGSPLAYSRSEAEQQKYVLIADIEAGKTPVITEIELHRGRSILRPRVRGVAEALSWLRDHTESYVEMTLELDDYLSSKDRRSLYESHPRLLTLIPEVSSVPQSDERGAADLDRPIEELFADYFAAGHEGNKPPDEIMGLFHEVLANSEEEAQ